MRRAEALSINVYRTIHRMEDGRSLCGYIGPENSRPYTGPALTGRECRLPDRTNANRVCGGRIDQSRLVIHRRWVA